MNENQRIGTLAYVLTKLREKRGKLYYGFVIVQKVVYFLVNAFGVRLPYSFYFYHFGPYTNELLRDLSQLEISEIITKEFDPNKLGYSIKVNDNVAQKYIDLAKPFIKRNKREEQINNAIDLLGNKLPAELELLATIHFVKLNNKNKSKSTILNKVQKLKPKYLIGEIKESYDFLMQNKLI